MQIKHPSEAELSQALAYLTTHRIWQVVPQDLLAQLLRDNTTLHCYETHEPIWSDERNYQRAMGLVLSGTAQVKKEHLLLSTHHKGDYFGLSTLYTPADFYAAEIVAETPCCILFWDKSAIDTIVCSYPDAAVNFIAYMCQRVYYLNARLDSLLGS